LTQRRVRDRGAVGEADLGRLRLFLPDPLEGDLVAVEELAQLRARLVVLRADHDPPARRHRVPRVARQVQDDLRQLLRIDLHLAHRLPLPRSPPRLIFPPPTRAVRADADQPPLALGHRLDAHLLPEPAHVAVMLTAAELHAVADPALAQRAVPGLRPPLAVLRRDTRPPGVGVRGPRRDVERQDALSRVLIQDLDRRGNPVV